jgi:hypothetical protein
MLTVTTAEDLFPEAIKTTTRRGSAARIALATAELNKIAKWEPNRTGRVVFTIVEDSQGMFFPAAVCSGDAENLLMVLIGFKIAVM